MREKDYNDEKMKLMEQLYARFYKPLYIYALSFLNDEEMSGDVVSDFFSDLWQLWQTTDYATPPPSNYLYTSVRNRCLDILRHDKVKQNYAKLSETREKFDNAEEVAAYERKITELSRILSQLPEPKKSIMDYCYFKHFTYRQTAEKLGLSVASVKKHIMRVFKMLRETLKNDKEFNL